MNRRHLLTGLFAAVALPSAASAQTAEEQVIRQLKRQGYTHITLRRTLLGRTRIIATGPQGRREIVLNPSTGAILRDYIDRSDSDRRDRDDRNDDQEDREDDREDERDDRNDDREDERDDREDDREDREDDREDNSGSGSSNSGKGSDNSGSGGGGGDDDDDDD